MNYAFARDQYRKSKNAALSSLSDPHEMVGLTLKELARSLNALQNISLTDEQRNAHLSKGFTAVYILQTSLAFDKGFDINFEDIKKKILANGQNATGMQVVSI